MNINIRNSKTRADQKIYLNILNIRCRQQQHKFFDHGVQTSVTCSIVMFRNLHYDLRILTFVDQQEQTKTFYDNGKISKKVKRNIKPLEKMFNF